MKQRHHKGIGSWLLIGSMVIVTGCRGGDRGADSPWAGTIDTLPGGQVLVHNPAEGMWEPGAEWTVVEEARIGRAMGEGPDIFGAVISFEVDRGGRLWVLDSQSQELRVFDANGSYVRTVGRQGEGPGEFSQAIKVELGPEGNLWVMDPSNNRLSVFDTAGVYLEGHPALGGFLIIPWPGRFDENGAYYAPVPLHDGELRIGLVRYDANMIPTDTLIAPEDPVERERFVQTGSDGGMMMASVPYQGSFTWRLSRTGTIWAILTDEYRLFEMNAEGDTLRTITRDFDPIPVTGADRDRAREDLEWFVSQGGTIDLSKIPRTKPPVGSFFEDDEGDVWVQVTANPEEQGRGFDVFDGAGRYLGMVHLTFSLSPSPAPVFRSGILYGVSRDELDVTYLVRARVEKG